MGRTEAKGVIARLEGQITCETMLLDLDRRSIDLGTAAHEMIHQLAVESGLVPRHDAFPHWLHEGLAAQFEVIRGGRWSGISPRPATCGSPTGERFKNRLHSSAWSETPGSGAGISVTLMRRLGPWCITCAPGIRENS